MENFTDDTVVTLASFLSPHDMLSLALSCKRFGSKHGTTTSRERRLAVREASKTGGVRDVRQKIEAISLMEAAARNVLQAKWTDDEKNALPRRGDESWIGLYQEFLKLFYYPLQFDKLVGRHMEYVEGSNKKSVCVRGQGLGDFGSAICNNIMRAGKHSVSFNVDNPLGGSGIVLGIMRPTTTDITSLTECYPAGGGGDLSRFSLRDYGMLNSYNIDSCLFSTINGWRFKWERWTDIHSRDITTHWEGMEGIRDTSFKVGFILDLDEGTLDVYKNDRRLGTIVAGLTGEYCWVVSLRSASDHQVVTSKNVSINR